jgi:hypothetical protein
MYSIYFRLSVELPDAHTVRVDVGHIVEAQTYWDKLSKANFYMVSTRP